MNKKTHGRPKPAGKPGMAGGMPVTNIVTRKLPATPKPPKRGA